MLWKNIEGYKFLYFSNNMDEIYPIPAIRNITIVPEYLTCPNPNNPALKNGVSLVVVGLRVFKQSCSIPLKYISSIIGANITMDNTLKILIEEIPNIIIPPPSIAKVADIDISMRNITANNLIIFGGILK